MAQGGAGAGRRNYTPRPRTYTPQAAKDRMIELLQDGMTVKAALEKVGRSQKTWEQWRKNDADFKARADQAKQLRKIDASERGERVDFATFRKKYLKTETFWHQLQWVDLIEGREPRDLHPAQTYSKGTSHNRLLILTPPFHAKSMSLTVDYSVYRLCMDPSYRILIISAGLDLAQQFLYAIKERLTSPDFLELQKAYAPEGGWEANAESWNDSRIVFGSDTRAQGNKGGHEKDPNVQAVGMGSKIYGRRADLIIVDDGVDETNVSAYAKQQGWLTRTVLSRLELGGKLVMVGTRIASIDLYSELLKPENYANGRVPWTHLASPAILEEGATPQEHVTLWPHSDEPWVRRSPDGVLQDQCICGQETCADGIEVNGKRLYARWDGVHLEKGPRADNSASLWALVYQQKSVPEDATFPEWKITKATNTARLAGILHDDRVGHPFGGMRNKYVIAALDPSIKGFAGIVALAVDRQTQKRYLLNAWNLKAPTKDQLVAKMKQVTEHYSVSEWRVEKTGLLQFFTQDRELRTWLNSRGVRFTEHLTGGNKWDAGFGVSSLAGLFGDYDKAWNDPNSEWREITPPLIEFPRLNTDGVKALIHQLITWTPDQDPNKVPQDVLMALWFAEVGAREHLGVGRPGGDLTVFKGSNKFIAPRSSKSRYTVRLADHQW